MEGTAIAMSADRASSIESRTCSYCAGTFLSTLPTKRYCNSRCSKGAQRRRQVERQHGPMPNCAACGKEKGSRKGRYCSRLTCMPASNRESFERNREKYAARARERERADRDKRRSTLGPKPPCKVCGIELNSWGAKYCSGASCQSEKRRSDNREYYRDNLDAHRARRSQYRARRSGATTERVDVLAIYERDRWRCGLCRRLIDKRLAHPHPLSRSLDHIVPLSLGGSHSAANLQAAHLKCNVAKGNRGSGEQLALI